jgi:L-threonylcarbamoyladenylate synthase
VIFPTETFYGLGCDALNPDAVGAVYAAKRRPYRLPLPVVIGDTGQLDDIAARVSPAAQKLMDRFWPGPLSIIFPARPEVPDLLTAGTRRIAVRLSSHPAAAGLCRESHRVLISSSANISGIPPVSRPQDLDPALADKVGGIYDQPPAPAGGEPSTIVDVVPGPGGQGVIRLLRQGAITPDMLRAEHFAVIASERE